MIIWLNGAFGAGKTTISQLLMRRIPEARIFDPEDLGYLIQKTYPPARQLDYQDLPLWRRLVSLFVTYGSARFSIPLIIPMTLVVPAYIEEIFSSIADEGIALHHFFLETSADELRRRITNQVIIDADAERDEEVRQWRLAQIERCMAARSTMPNGTIFLDTEAYASEALAEMIVGLIRE